ncbi:PR domain zinc finger protein 5-like [Contarinia nasturtii]|uniref:PR domain zinc finger protein 5-like n=1 Tax=Contarinia nasturtii TaxID=265458 RepID=UPI0012D45BAD|nr:PR domain zinc finger protein 5-like [Contarinia nasturtii]
MDVVPSDVGKRKREMESSGTNQRSKIQYCVVRDCTNFRGSKDLGTYFFTLSSLNLSVETRNKWELAITGKQTGNMYIGKICDRHFKRDDMYYRKGVPSRLRPEAFPVLHLPQYTTKNVTQEANPLFGELKLVDIDAIKNNTNDTELIKNRFSKQSSLCEHCTQKDVKIESLKAKIFDLVRENQQFRDRIKNMESMLTNGQTNNEIIESSTLDGIDELEQSVSAKKIDLPQSLETVHIKVEADVEISEPIEQSTLQEVVKVEPKQESNPHINKYFKCGECGMTFQKPLQLSFHMHSAHLKMKLFQCSECNKTFEEPLNLKEHVRYIHNRPKETKRVRCYLCKQKFSSREELLAHRGDAHKKCPKKIKSFQCVLCKLEIDSKEALRMHMKLHSRDHLCDVCKVPFTLDELNNHLCDNEGSVCCEYCQQTFTTTIKLLEHLGTHDKKKFYRCDECPKSFPMIKLKQYHITVSHSKPKLFTCTICRKAFATKRSRTTHEKSHNAVRSHLCDECGRGFRSARNLKLHKESSMHAAEALFQCPDCPHKCYRKDQLKRHSVIHSNDSFVCEICTAQLPSMKNLMRHMTRHTRTEANRKYACSLCPMKFFSAKVLKEHQAVHGNAKLHACQYCEQSFKYAGDLYKHLKIHLGELRYQCEKCDKRFKYKVEAVQHEFEHYKQEKNERNEIE